MVLFSRNLLKESKKMIDSSILDYNPKINKFRRFSSKNLERNDSFQEDHINNRFSIYKDLNSRDDVHSKIKTIR